MRTGRPDAPPLAHGLRGGAGSLAVRRALQHAAGPDGGELCGASRPAFAASRGAAGGQPGNSALLVDERAAVRAVRDGAAGATAADVEPETARADSGAGGTAAVGGRRAGAMALAAWTGGDRRLPGQCAGQLAGKRHFCAALQGVGALAPARRGRLRPYIRICFARRLTFAGPGDYNKNQDAFP